MAISSRRSSTSEGKTPLLNDTVEGVVDYKGRPARRSKSGGWRSAGFIIGKPQETQHSSSFPKFIGGYVIFINVNVCVCRCGDYGEICILWDQLQSDKLSDRASRTIDGYGGGERKRVGWNFLVVASTGCLRS